MSAPRIVVVETWESAPGWQSCWTDERDGVVHSVMLLHDTEPDRARLLALREEALAGLDGWYRERGIRG